jgi:hypothetical protein
MNCGAPLHKCRLLPDKNSRLIYLLIYLQTHSLSYWVTYSLTYILTFLLTGLLTHLCTYTFTYLLLSYLLTYSLTPWSRVLLEKLTGSHLVKKFPAFYVTRRFRTAFTRASHLSVSWDRSTQSMLSHPTSWRFIFTLSSQIRLGLSSGLFPSGFPTKILYTPLLSHTPVTCSTHLVLLDLIARIKFGEEHRSLSSSLCSFLHSPVTSSLLDPNNLHDILFPNIRSLLTVPISIKIFGHKPRAFLRLILLK